MDSSPTSPFCRKWPNDHYFCNGPLLSGEEAYARIEQSGLTNGATLVGIRSSPAAGLTPDGDQSMKDGGWRFTFYRADGWIERIEVRADSVQVSDTSPPDGNCHGERVVPDGLSKEVSTAARLVEETYAASFVPGTFAINLTRDAACISISSLSRTVLEFQLDISTVRTPTVEFDGAGTLVGSCNDAGQFRGCRSGP